MEALKQIWGEEPSDEKIRKDIAPLTKDIFVILHLTDDDEKYLLHSVVRFR